ncbi:MAG: hypothetical protein LBI36_05615 [Oscillospiraceae bacterium]|jgi:hypothetical protein|nr:hypothetical protein [Oscillospiraceae bacterium]
MYACSKCGGALNPNGVCPNCGTAHSISPQQPVQQQFQQPPQQQPVQPQFQQPPQSSGGNPLDKFFAVNSEDDANVVLGEKRFKVPLVVAVLAGLNVIFYFMPFLTATVLGAKMSVSLRVFSGTASMGGMSANADLSGLDLLLSVILFLIPVLICGLAVGLSFFADKVKSALRFLEGKLFLSLTAGAGGGILFLIIFLVAYSEDGLSVGPGIGWALSLLMYVLIGAISFMCMKKTK